MLRMAKSSKKKIAFISSYPPRKCGIATFTSDLIESIRSSTKGGFEALVVAMGTEKLKYQDPVKFEIRQDVKMITFVQRIILTSAMWTLSAYSTNTVFSAVRQART
jgi:hypothetical protein